MVELRTLAEIEEGLSHPIPPVFLGEKVKGGTRLTIFSVWTAQKFLDYWAPGWMNDVTFAVSAERVVCVAHLTIPTSDMGNVTRSGSGDDSEDDDEMPEFESDADKKKWVSEQNQRGYGSPATRAEAQAFKRAAARFGFGVYLRDRGKPLYITDEMVGEVRGQSKSVSQKVAPETTTQTTDERPRAFGGPGGFVAERPTPTPAPTPWENLERYATDHLVKIGAADKLISDFMTALHANMVGRGTIDNVGACREAYALIRSWETTQPVVLWMKNIERATTKATTTRAAPEPTTEPEPEPTPEPEFVQPGSAPYVHMEGYPDDYPGHPIVVEETKTRLEELFEGDYAPGPFVQPRSKGTRKGTTR